MKTHKMKHWKPSIYFNTSSQKEKLYTDKIQARNVDDESSYIIGSVFTACSLTGSDDFWKDWLEIFVEHTFGLAVFWTKLIWELALFFTSVVFFTSVAFFASAVFFAAGLLTLVGSTLKLAFELGFMGPTTFFLSPCRAFSIAACMEPNINYNCNTIRVLIKLYQYLFESLTYLKNVLTDRWQKWNERMTKII